MRTRLRSLAPITFILLAGCSENRLGVGAVDAASNTGNGGAPGGSGGAGSGGLATSGTGGAATSTGGSVTSTGGAGGSASGSCGEATCLVSLFQTCVPEGECATRHGSTTGYDICYANGVTVSYYHGGYETTTTVRRNGVLCYRIKRSTTPDDSGDSYLDSYVITDGNDNEVATGVSADKSATVSVTCTGGTPITVDGSCLWGPGSGNFATCNLDTCPTSGTGGYDGGTAGFDGGVAVDVSGAGSVCDPFAAIPRPIALAAILGAGLSADGTVYVVDQLDSTLRAFVSDASGTLVRQRVDGSGTTNDASGVEYVISLSSSPSPLVIKIDVATNGTVRMGVLHGALKDTKSFVIGQEGEELTVLASSAVAGMPLRNLPGEVTVEYVATLPDGQLVLVTRPTDDWAYTDFRLFLGPTDAVVERTVTSVTRMRDGGTTYIVFDLDGAEATAYFPVVRPDAGPNPVTGTLTAAGVTTPLARQSTVPAASYRCL